MKEYFVSAMCMCGTGEFRAGEYIMAESKKSAVDRFIELHSPTNGDITVMLKEDYLKEIKKERTIF